MSGCGVILCKCNGALERSISLEDLTRYINGLSQDIDIISADNLCKSRDLNPLLENIKTNPAVIVACNEIPRKPGIWQGLDDANTGLCLTQVIDIVHELSAGFSDSEISARIKLLLASHILKAFARSEVSQDNMKLCFSHSGDNITRRKLAASLLPRYEIVPCIVQSDCLGASCNLCAGVCPAGAISESKSGFIINKSSCTGCGACVNACPRAAISHPGYSISEMEREIEGLLLEEAGLPHRILAFVSDSCLSGDDISFLSYSPSILTVRVPSLSIVSPLILLHAFNLGADGILLIHDNSGKLVESPDGKVAFVRELLERWGINGNRIECMNSADDDFDNNLGIFCKKMADSGHTSFKAAAGSMTFEGMYSLAAIIKEMDSKQRIAENRVLSGDVVPFGVVAIDRARCSGCRVCTYTCPAGAITARLSDENSALEILFRHDKCMACGLCENVCPEKCLTVGRMLDCSGLDDRGAVIFENESMFCRNCGKPYATKSMIDMLRRKLEVAGAFSAEWTEYCPSCRLAIQQKR